jgi:hypothetical protein
MNGATEQTLAELLATAQAMNVNLVKLNGLVGKMNTSGGGGSSSSSSSSGSSNPASMAGSALSSLGETVGSVGGLIGKVLGGAVSLVAGIFGALGSIISSTIGTFVDLGKSLFEFSKKAMEGTARLSDFLAAFSTLPFGIGTLFSLASALTTVNERLLDFYRDLTKVGASFSGNLFEMMRSAANAHLALGDFAKVVSHNSEVFASMGGNVQEGINRFSNSMNKLMDTNGPFARKLLALGYTAEQAADLTAKYMANQGTMNKKGLEDANLVSQGVMEYAQQLDGLSKLTGKSREKLQQEIDEVQMEETWKSFLAGMDPKEAQKLSAAVAQQTALGGKEAGNSLKLAFQGINVPLTDAQKALEVQSNGMMSRSNEQIVAGVKAGMTQEQVIRQVTKNAVDMGNQISANQKQMGAGMTGFLQATGNAQVTATSQFVVTARNLKEGDKAFDKAVADRMKQESGNAKELAVAEQKVKEFGQQLTLMFSRISELLMPTVMKLANIFLGLAEKYMPKLAEVAEWAAGKIVQFFAWAEGYFNDLVGVYNNAGGWKAVFTKIWNDSTKALSDMWDKVWPVVKPKLEQAFKDLSDYLKPLWDKLMHDISIKIKDWIGDNTWFGESSKDRKERESVIDSKSYKEWTEAAKKSTDIVGQFGYFVRKAVNEDPKQAYETYQEQVRNGSWKPGNVEVSPKDRRASGGLVSPGSYLVGEQGPEIVNTSMSGDVISNDNLTALLKNSNNNNVVAALERLNNTQLQLLAAMHLNNNMTDKQVKATVALGNDLFA